MASLREPLRLDTNDISSICGSISIACWLVVFLPQLIENIRRRSTEGLSVRFVSIWLSGDICNVLGAVLQGVLPTMIILAVYYASVDILLLGQIFYYRGFTWKEDTLGAVSSEPHESRRLLAATNPSVPAPLDQSSSTLLSAAHLSPAVPFVPEPEIISAPRSVAQNAFLKCLAIVTVVLVGISGWFLTRSATPESSAPPLIIFSPWGQAFGYFCAILYLSSRLPQLLLNYRRKSTEGISVLFFLFACIGNLTYVLSILVYEPYCESQSGISGHCKSGELQKNYWRHIAVNTSWLIGSAGTCLLDFCIFTQFWLYRKPTF